MRNPKMHRGPDQPHPGRRTSDSLLQGAPHDEPTHAVPEEGDLARSHGPRRLESFEQRIGGSTVLLDGAAGVVTEKHRGEACVSLQHRAVARPAPPPEA